MIDLSKFLSIPPCPHMSLLLFPFRPSILSNNNVTVRRFYKLFHSIPNEAVYAPQITQKYLNIKVFKKKDTTAEGGIEGVQEVKSPAPPRCPNFIKVMWPYVVAV